MSTNKRKKNKYKKGKGISEFIENIGNKIKNGAVSAHKYIKDKK